MTPAQLDHLRLIDAHLEHLLNIAAKRTPGHWDHGYGNALVVHKKTDYTLASTLASTSSGEVVVEDCPIIPWQEQVANSEYIASCAGNAEAGWRATRAAIADWLSLYNSTEGYADGAQDATAHDKMCNEVASICRINMQHILAAFPLKSLKP